MSIGDGMLGSAQRVNDFDRSLSAVTTEKRSVLSKNASPASIGVTPCAELPCVTVEAIYAAVLKIVEAEDAAAFSVSRLASVFGVPTPSLDAAVNSRENVLQIIGGVLGSRLQNKIQSSECWHGAAWRWFLEIHRELTRHPNLTLLLGNRLPAVVFSRLDDLIDAAIDAGLSRRHSTEVMRALANTTLNDALAVAGSSRPLDSNDVGECAAAKKRELSDALKLILDGASVRAGRCQSCSHSPAYIATVTARREHSAGRMSKPQEVSLAWALAEVVKTRLDPACYSWLCANIGAGEYRTALEWLLPYVVAQTMVLSVDLGAQLRRWLSGFSGAESEGNLRQLIDQLTIEPAVSGQREGCN